MIEWHGRPLTLLINVGHIAVLGVEQNLGVVLEVNLDNFVAETEHDSVFGSHPFFDVNGAWRVL